jgi:hypothetical protein
MIDRIRKSKDRQHYDQKKKDRQHYDQKKDRQHYDQMKDRQHYDQKKDRQHYAPRSTALEGSTLTSTPIFQLKLHNDTKNIKDIIHCDYQTDFLAII